MAPLIGNCEDALTKLPLMGTSAETLAGSEIKSPVLRASLQSQTGRAPPNQANPDDETSRHAAWASGLPSRVVAGNAATKQSRVWQSVVAYAPRNRDRKTVHDRARTTPLSRWVRSRFVPCGFTSCKPVTSPKVAARLPRVCLFVARDDAVHRCCRLSRRGSRSGPATVAPRVAMTVTTKMTCHSAC